MRKENINTYYQVFEIPSQLVSGIWKGAHILCLIGIIISSVCSVYGMSRSTRAFGNNCILNADLHFSNKMEYKPVGNFTKTTFHNSKTQWGYRPFCTRMIATFFSSGVMASILLIFFTTVSKGGFNKYGVFNKSFSIVIPTTFIAGIMTILICEAYIRHYIGIKHFCKQFEPYINSTSCHSNALNEYSLIFHGHEKPASDYINAIKIFSLCSAIFWISLLASLIARLLYAPDFKIVAYQLSRVNKKSPRISDMSSDDHLSHTEENTKRRTVFKSQSKLQIEEHSI